MDLGLHGKTALVLGAGGGLGSEVAIRLAQEGAHVALADMHAESLERTYRRITEQGGAALAVQWDLAKVEKADEVLTRIEERFGQVDVLFNNTGGPPPTPAYNQDPELWENHFRSMVLSVIKLTDAVLPGMIERGWGRVITSTSSGIVAPIPNLAISNALRMSLLGWSKTLAREVARHGITVNVVLPGRIATDRIRFLDEARSKRENRPLEEVIAESVSTIPAQRYGTPREYADVVAFLASECAAYVTGAVQRVDGGLIASV